jgi:hypothetical protein
MVGASGRLGVAWKDLDDADFREHFAKHKHGLNSVK